MRDINKLIMMYRQGSQEAFEEIFNIYKNLMYNIISKYNKTVINSKDDLMQIASISLLKALHKLSTRSEPKACNMIAIQGDLMLYLDISLSNCIPTVAANRIILLQFSKLVLKFWEFVLANPRSI